MCPLAADAERRAAIFVAATSAAPEVGVGFLFDTLHSVEGHRGMHHHMELVEGDAGVGQVR
jgi:hypothetical protein